MNKYRDKIIEAEGQRKAYIDQLEELENRVQEYEDKLNIILFVRLFFQGIAKKTQENVKFHIERVGQSALDSIFPDTYKFSIDFVSRKGKTEAEFSIIKQDNKINPMNSSGGGIVDIISLSLRITLLSISGNRKVMILDEPLRFVSKNYQPIIIDLLKELEKRLGLQFIMITHDYQELLSANKVFTVSINKRGISLVEERGE